MERQLRLFLDDGTRTFDIFDFEYNAQRMGGAPTITATLYSYDAVSTTTNDWCQFVSKEGELGEEKFLIRNEPTKLKSSSDARYKYTFIFVSEREILDNVYFIDASKSSVFEGKVVSKGVDFMFAGTVKDYVNKLNDSLSLSKLQGYSVVIDNAVASQDIANVTKVFSLSKATYTAGLQEIYNQFDIPYYFVEKTIHVGYYNEGVPSAIVRYGSDDALIQVSKTSKNNKIITRCTGLGSNENLPSYYPNLSQTGEHKVSSCSGNITKAKIKSVDYDKIAGLTNLRDGALLTFKTKSPVFDKINDITVEYLDDDDGWYNTNMRSIKGGYGSFTVRLDSGWNHTSEVKYQHWDCKVSVTFYAEKGVPAYGIIDTQFAEYVPVSTATYAQRIKSKDIRTTSLSCNGKGYGIDSDAYTFDGVALTLTPLYTGKHTFTVFYKLTLEAPLWSQNAAKDTSMFYSWCGCTVNFNYATSVQMEDYVTIDGYDGTLPWDDCGVEFVSGFKPNNNSTITLSETLNWLQPQPSLMPSIYRETLGYERFYNAINGGYTVEVPEKELSYDVNMDSDAFVNEYSQSRFTEHIETFDDIKPTIEESVNQTTKLRMDMFEAFDYDNVNGQIIDSEESDVEGNLKHPYFYAKIRQLDFNIFDHALEDGEVTFSFTSGDCAPCSFKLLVDSDTKKNTLQLDSSGNIKRNADGSAVFDVNNPIASQNDTSKNPVWVALQKENTTYGEWMPNNAYRPKGCTSGNNDGDTFVILNIRMPSSYIYNAEKKLEERIIEYMKQNNLAGYNFDIKFSRIFLEENKATFTKSLNESSRLILNFQGSEYQLYVNSFNYKVTAEDVLPDISVSISDSLQLSKGGLSTLVSSVKSDVLAAVSNIDILPTLARYAIRKDQDDATIYGLTAGSLNVKGDSTFVRTVDVGKNLIVGGASSVKNGLTIGNFTDAIGSINGGRITHEGDAAFRSIRANYLEVMALVYNQIKASSAYTVFDDTGTITEIYVEEVDGNKVYTLTFEESELSVKNENGLGVQSFVKDDIVHGRVNNINNYEFSRAGECWMKIIETPSSENELKDNQVKAILYDDASVPTPPNLEPTVNMTVAHQGNETDKSRQCTFYISSKDGNIIQLLEVDRPKLYNAESDGYSNYGVVIGTLPPDLFQYVKDYFAFVTEKDPVVYARYGVFENLLQLDYLGRPIKTSNFRGEWNLDTAVNDPYRVTSTTYDTVTHDGSLWECRLDGTLTEPSSNTTDWLLIISKGYDGAPIYSFRLSNTSITVDSDGGLSTNGLSFTIGETTARGYNILNKEIQLGERRLKVQYSINGRIDNVGGASFDNAGISLEDNSGFVLTEDGLKFMIDSISGRRNVKLAEDGYLVLEAGDGYISTEDGFKFVFEGNGGGIIPVDASCDLITLYLVDVENNIDLVVQDIPVIRDGKSGKDGEDGKDGITVHGEPSTINIQISADDNKLINNKTHTFSVYARTATSLLKTEEYSVSIPNVSNYTFSTPYVVDNKYNFTAIIADNAKKEDISSFSVKFTSKDGTNIGELVIATSFSERGITGPAGKAAPMLYPAGTWNKNTEYRKENDSVPFVYYDHDTNDANEGLYYILEVDSIISDKSPAEDTTSWRPMTQYEAIYTKFIMANWAQFGSENGGVFYDKWLFSQQGRVDDATEDSPYNKNVIGADGEFSEWKPNLALDFKKGRLLAKDADITGNINATSGRFSGSISTPAIELTTSEAHILNFDTGFNFSGAPSDAQTILLPEGKEYEGVQCSIINYAGNGYYRIRHWTETTEFLSDSRNRNFSGLTYVHLYACSELRLKAVKVNDRVRWFIQNASNFGPTYSEAEGKYILSNQNNNGMTRCIGRYMVSMNQKQCNVSDYSAVDENTIVSISSSDALNNGVYVCTYNFKFRYKRNNIFYRILNIETLMQKPHLGSKYSWVQSSSAVDGFTLHYYVDASGYSTIESARTALSLGANLTAWSFEIFEYNF